MIGFYIFLLCMKVDPWLALAGAIAYFGVSAGAASEISSTLAGVSVVSSFY